MGTRGHVESTHAGGLGRRNMDQRTSRTMNKTLDKRAITTKLMHEAHQLMVIFVYLAVFFFVFKLYTRLLLREYGIGYFVYGLTLLKALVLSKIILTAEMLHVGERFNDRPLSVPTLYKTITFSL